MKKLYCKKTKRHFKDLVYRTTAGSGSFNVKQLAQETTKFQGEINCKLDSIHAYHVIHSNHVQYHTFLFTSEQLEKKEGYEEIENVWEWIHR